VIVADEATRVQIRELRAEFKEGLVDIKTGLGALLPREVYSANHEALKHRVEVLEREQERAEAERTNNRRWFIASVVVPLVSMAVMIILAVT
jgi:ABC-type transport system involved in cytochrome bd biosynthesis fused ATPase/permease subunit